MRSGENPRRSGAAAAGQSGCADYGRDWISVIGLPKESEARMAEPDNAASEPRIRSATVADVRAVAQIVEDAYCVYVPRMGKPPGPMLDDYSARVTEGVVWVVEEGTT